MWPAPSGRGCRRDTARPGAEAVALARPLEAPPSPGANLNTCSADTRGRGTSRWVCRAVHPHFREPGGLVPHLTQTQEAKPPTVSGSWSLQNRVDLPPGSSGDPPSPSLPCAPARHLAARRRRDRPRRVGGSSRMAPGSTLRPPASTRLSPARRPGRSFGAAAGPATPAVHPPPPRAGGCWISGGSSDSLY